FSHEYSPINYPILQVNHRIEYMTDVLTYPLLWSGLLYQINLPQGNVISAIYAVILSYFMMLITVTLVEKIKKQPQMGRGDLKLIAACAAWLGVWLLPYFIGLAACLGLLHYAFAHWVLPKISQGGHSPSCVSAKPLVNEIAQTIPFGPTIIISASILLYLSILRIG
ncbi:prepilin peptidase, partial [Providencia rettgeri]|uniref:prepilin peptidase n=1 Tax=Providencia rettgeri TaxID=587 RepID=UPI00247FE7C6